MRIGVGNRVHRRHLAAILLLTVCLAGAFWLQRLRRWTTIAPDHDALYVSTRYITGIVATPDGTVWAGSLGGVLQRRPDGTWQRYTRLEGLPSQEVRDIEFEHGHVIATTPLGRAVFRQGRWIAVTSDPSGINSPPHLTDQTCATFWKGDAYAANPTGLFVLQWKTQRAAPGLNASSARDHPSRSLPIGAPPAAVWRDAPFPPSTGTHISALCPHGDTLLAALYGDGLWAYDGRKWQHVPDGLPQAAHEVTALATDGSAVWVGTRRAGLWEGHETHWVQRLQGDEPVSHNCQAISLFHDCLYVGTLEDGIAVRTSRGWGHVQAPTLSFNAPRQMVEYEGMLYVRHGNGKVDRTDGLRWERNIGARLPRNQATAIAADKRRLYVAQWGGWSEFDGKTWTDFLHLHELQGAVITALLPDHDRLWIGTQGHGVAEYSRTTGLVRWHDERDGLPDDWVTTLAFWGNRVCAGTFVGGLAIRDGDRWRVPAELAGEDVTALEPYIDTSLLIATRHGAWQLSGEGRMRRFSGMVLTPDPEVQALCRSATGMWVGARTGLYFIRQP